PGKPWKNGPVPTDKAIYGLGPVEITVSYFDDFKKILEDVYGMKQIYEEENLALIETGEGGNGGQIILKSDQTKQAHQGYGEVYQLTVIVKYHDDIKEWEALYDELVMCHSGNVDCFYFEELYTIIGDILIELSTDGPGFMDDEPYETLGESLALPPFLEPQREYIESEIRPFDTSRS